MGPYEKPSVRRRRTVTDEPKPDPEDELREAARESVKTDPEPVPDAAGLPDDVPSEPIEDKA